MSSILFSRVHDGILFVIFPVCQHTLHPIQYNTVQYNTFSTSSPHKLSCHCISSLSSPMFYMHSPSLIRRSFHFYVAVSTCVHAEVSCDSTLNSVDTLWASVQDSCSPAKRFLGSLLGPCIATTLPATPHFEEVVIIDRHCHSVVGAVC